MNPEGWGFSINVRGAQFRLELNAGEQAFQCVPMPCALLWLAWTFRDSEWDMEKVGAVMVFMQASLGA